MEREKRNNLIGSYLERCRSFFYYKGYTGLGQEIGTITQDFLRFHSSNGDREEIEKLARICERSVIEYFGEQARHRRLFDWEPQDSPGIRMVIDRNL